ncbi:MAG: helix-turn-helix domain-containing protein [Bacteroidota bacterium]
MRTIEDKLLEQLDTLYKKRSSLVQELEHAIALKESSIYKRLNGERPFTLQEVEQIITYFNLDRHALFCNDVTLPAFAPQSTAEGNINDLLEKWAGQVEHIARQENPSILMTTSTLPFSLAMSFTDLVKYRLYFMVKYLKQYREMKTLPFDPSSNLYRQVDRYCQRIHRVYDSLPTTEIWGSMTFQTTIHQMAFLHDNEQLSTDVFLHLLDQLRQLADRSNSYAKSGYRQANTTKRIHSDRPIYRLYLNHTSTVEEYTILAWYEKEQHQSHIFHPIYGIATAAHHKTNIEKSCYTLMETGIPISIANGDVRKRFFRKVKKAIDEKREELGRL